MRFYIGLVHQDSDSAFGLQFPDVPGCFSAADALEDLLPKASEALALHLEGSPLPKARTLHEVQADTFVIKELRNDAFLMAVPLIELN